MTDIKPAFFEYEPNEEHLVRRLGAALVIQWMSLPTDVQSRLLSQAGLVEDREPTVQLRQQLELFIAKHNPEWDE